jgi:UDP-2-acetamido-2-deoxy-ribo-hexuluronate aminotransferase
MVQRKLPGSRGRIPIKAEYPVKFIDLQSQFAAYEADIRAGMDEVLRSSQFILGPKGAELERKLASYVGTRHAVGCSSGTDALLLALMAHGTGPGDEILTSPFTFVATAEAIALTGATPVFVDIEPESYNIDPAKVEDAVTKKTRGIIAVSLYGQCADLEALQRIASEYGLFLIEDGCQSFGAARNGKLSCGFSHAGTTSFFPSKPLGCYGDGGMVFTSDDAVADRLAGLRNHGQWERYRHRAVGINGRLDELQAAVLLAKFPHFPSELSLRAAAGTYYSERLADVVTVPSIAAGNTHVYAQYSIRTPRRDELAAHLGENGIPTAVHYPIPLHRQEAFSGLGYEEGDFPVASAVSREILSLPMSAFLSRKDQDEVIRQIRRFFGE